MNASDDIRRKLGFDLIDAERREAVRHPIAACEQPKPRATPNKADVARALLDGIVIQMMGQNAEELRSMRPGDWTRIYPDGRIEVIQWEQIYADSEGGEAD